MDGVRAFFSKTAMFISSTTNTQESGTLLNVPLTKSLVQCCAVVVLRTVTLEDVILTQCAQRSFKSFEGSLMYIDSVKHNL